MSRWSRFRSWISGRPDGVQAAARGQVSGAGPVRLLGDARGRPVEVEVQALARTPGGGVVLDPSSPARVTARRGGARDYEAAGLGRNNEGWWAPNTSANVEIRKGLQYLRARSRDLARNNGHAERALTVLVANLIGEGIRPRSATGDPKLDAKVNALWEAWQKDADDFHGLDFYGVQELAVRAWLESGEVLIRRRFRRFDERLAVPFQVEVYESDLLDLVRNEDTISGGRIVAGVEFNGIGRRVAYWILPAHPGDQGLATGNMRYLGAAEGYSSKPISAGEIVHLFKPKRPGQVRGVPVLAPVMQDIRDLDDYGYAERIRKKYEACFVAFVLGNTPSDIDPEDEGLVPAVEDEDGNLVGEMAPGQVNLVRDGKDVKMNAPAATPGYAEYKAAELREIAAGAGVTYEQLSGDLSGVSFASYRVGRVEFFRAARQLHRLLLVPKLCNPVWGWFAEAAQAAGKLPLRADGYPVKWSEPRFESIERDRDANADKLEVRNGTRSLYDVIASQGKDPVGTLQEIAAAFAKLDELGLVLDSDPRRVGAPGAGSAAAPAESEDEPKPETDKPA